MKRKMDELNITNMVTKALYTLLAVYRLMTWAPTRIIDGDWTIVIYDITGELKKQKLFCTVFRHDKKVAKGWFGLNGYSGAAHPEFDPVGTVGSFADLLKLRKEIRAEIFRIVNCLGQINLPGLQQEVDRRRNRYRKAEGERNALIFVDGAKTIRLKNHPKRKAGTKQSGAKHYTTKEWGVRGHYADRIVGHGTERRREPRWINRYSCLRSPDLLEFEDE